jgi:hypothetical protein
MIPMKCRNVPDRGTCWVMAATGMMNFIEPAKRKRAARRA